LAVSIKSRQGLLEEFERASLVRSRYTAALVGTVLGPAIVLGVAVAVIVAVSHWSSLAAKVLAGFVIVGALSSAVELLLVTANRLKLSPADPKSGWNGLVLAGLFEQSLFWAALAFLYWRLGG
jgi:hypothetical protein